MFLDSVRLELVRVPIEGFAAAAILDSDAFEYHLLFRG
jgi:hypothetical protein